MLGGTSFAAPHVTGAAAVLQQYGNVQNQANPNWGANAARHEVTKAVLMNSADKLKDNGNGFLLGMTREIFKQDGTSNWLDGPATAQNIPLDDEMGAGHLNVDRAIQQFASGEVDTQSCLGCVVNPNPGAPGASRLNSTIVPQIGRDYANTDDTGGQFNIYEFTDPLPAGSYVSITVAWDRVVELNDTAGGNPGAWDLGESFTVAGPSGEGFNDINLELRNAGDESFGVPVAASRSGANLEHLFFQIPTTGDYEFWVNEEFSPLGPGGTDYAVAWWAFDGPVGVAGDISGDGVVDAADLDLLAANTGPVPPGDPAFDLDGDGVIEYDNNINGPIASDSDVLVRQILGTQYGDFNLDGKVDNGDLNILSGNWAQPGGWGDANGDGSATTDNGDLNALLGSWGFGVTAAVPEPTTLLIATLCLGTVSVRRP